MDPVSKAQSENGAITDSLARRNAQLRPPWKPGESGNPSGRPRKARITKIYQKIFASAKNRADVEEAILKTLLGGKMASVLLLREAAERTEGKVLQELQINEKLESLTDEQLALRAIKLDAEIEGRLEKSPELDSAISQPSGTV